MIRIGQFYLSSQNIGNPTIYVMDIKIKVNLNLASNKLPYSGPNFRLSSLVELVESTNNQLAQTLPKVKHVGQITHFGCFNGSPWSD